jgi:Bacterial toxin 34
MSFNTRGGRTKATGYITIGHDITTLCLGSSSAKTRWDLLAVVQNFYGYAGNDPIDFTDPFGLHTPVAVPVLVGIGKDLIVPGITTVGGVIIVVGEAAPAVGLAGTIGWGIGRGIGHLPTVGGGTVDSGWQDIFTRWLYPETAANWALAGRALCLAKGTTNTSDTGIMAEVYEMIRLKQATDICDALDKLAASASGIRLLKIKATQKYHGCRRSSYSG